MLSIEYIKKGKAVSNTEIFDAVKEYIDDNYYDNIEKQHDKRFETSDNKITFTLKGLNGGEAKMKSISQEIANSLNAKGGFNIAFQCITIGSSHKVQFVVRQQVEEALKFSPADNGAVASALKIPKDKISDFLSDVSSKFNLKKFKKYSTEFWSQSSGEANSKYYITKSIAGNLHAFVNTKFDSTFHKDIEAFKEYLEQKIESYKPEPVEEEEVVAIDRLAAPADNGISQEEMTIPMFKNESKFIKEHAVVNLDEMKEIFGGSQVYNMLLDAAHGGPNIKEAKAGDGTKFRTKIINENKFILEEQVVDVQPEDVINDGISGLVGDEVKPGDEVITKDFHVMYYISLANGAGVLVSPSLNAVKIMMAGMGEPDQDEEDEAVVECKYSDISHFNESKDDDEVQMEISFDGGLMTAYFTETDAAKIGMKKFPGSVNNKVVLPKAKLPELKTWADDNKITYKMNESSTVKNLDDLLGGKGWGKGGVEDGLNTNEPKTNVWYKWTKFSTTTEKYLLVIDTKDKSYSFVYDPSITEDDKQIKTSKKFSFEDYSDIILPSTMDEFDHVMSIKADDLFKKGSTMEYKGKKVKIKKYNFGKYVVKLDGKEEEVDGKDLVPVAESKTLSKGDSVKDKNGQLGEVISFDPIGKQGPTKFPGGAVKVKYSRKLKIGKQNKDGIYIEPANDLELVTESKYKQYILKENAQGFEEYYTKAEIKKFLEDNGVEHDGENEWWTATMEHDKGASANDAYLIVQSYGGDALAKKWKKSHASTK